MKTQKFYANMKRFIYDLFIAYFPQPLSEANLYVVVM